MAGVTFQLERGDVFAYSADGGRLHCLGPCPEEHFPQLQRQLGWALRQGRSEKAKEIRDAIRA